MPLTGGLHENAKRYTFHPLPFMIVAITTFLPSTHNVKGTDVKTQAKQYYHS
ncbi:hypothetical protein FRC11_004661, partial [Ceratobasidium sp. 423]